MLKINMSGFNNSGRKEDMSLRLRAQNLKNARDQTKRLEDDNRKMEERLKELKNAMNREKEERERQGGGFWGRGQSHAGSLTNYASEVLHSKAEKPPKEAKKKKVKVLQDEPLDVPKRSSQPGTMKYIAQRKLTTGATPRDKQKGPKCGQCEDRTATLSCVQCSEIYCPGCFAAFHLKGALKQHRSVPLSASGPRVCMSPRTSVDAHSPRGSQASGSVPSQSNTTTSANGSEASGPPSKQIIPHSNTPSLLEGDYDESQSAASFQQALMAWRHGDQPSTHRSNSVSPRKPIASPVKSPVVAVDESTGTPEQTKVPEIKFKSTLSYAERLMLKKHRRTELAGVSGQSNQSPSSPRSDVSYSQWHASSGRSDSQSRSSGSFSMTHETFDSRRIEGIGSRMDSFVGEDEHVNFQSLFEAVATSASPETNVHPHSSRSNVSISEVLSNVPTSSEVPALKSSTTYVVQEVTPLESWQTEQNLKIDSSSSTFVIDQTQKKYRDFKKFSQGHGETITELYQARDNTTSSSVTSETQPNEKLQGISEISQISSPVREDALPSSRSKSRKQSRESSKHLFKEEIGDLDSISTATSPEEKPPKTPSRPRSSKSRVGTARGKTDKASRAASRIGSAGHLTKAPSDALRQIAQMAQSPDHSYTYQSPMEGFFLVGVEGEKPPPVQDRVMTPTKSRTTVPRPKSRAESLKSARGEKETIKVSNRLYQMAPRSWRPDSSLGDAVPLSQVKVDTPEEEMTMSYSYSGQMGGHPVEWRPGSSQSRIGVLSDDLGLNPSLMFGDEMFTDEAAAAATPTPRVASVQRSFASGPRSSEYGQGDSKDFELLRKDGSATPKSSFQARQKSAGRRSRDLTTPTNISGDFRDPKITPTPPVARQGHDQPQRSSDGTFSPALSRSKRSTDSKVKDREGSVSSSLGRSVEKSRSSREDEGDLKLSRHNIRTPKLTESSQNMPSSRPGSQRLTSKQNQPMTATHQSGTQGEIHEARLHGSQKTKTESSQDGSMSRQDSYHSYKESKRALSRHESDVSSNRRPVSSTNLPASSQGQKRQPSRGEIRPSSSTGGTEPLRKTQPSLQAANTQSYEDTIISDVMMARVQEDGWMGDDSDNDDDNASVSYDYDDGDDPTPVSLRRQQVKQMTHKPSHEQWETEIRPFSGLSIDSKGGHSARQSISARGDNKRPRPPSSRPLSTMSQRSGRESRAIVMDGEDLSQYDNMGVQEEQNIEDKQALDQLEWELASDTGRLTADGQISRMDVLGSDNDDVRSSSSRSSTRSLRMSADKDYDLAAKLQEDEKRAERDVDDMDMRRSVTMDEDEVRALR